MDLTKENVNNIVADCLYMDEELVDGQPPEGFIEVEGIMNRFGFHPDRLAGHRDDIKSMLLQLPEEFHLDGGGGWSFLNACVTKDGDQWGEHIPMDALFALGMGCGMVKSQLPREIWSALPGGMPYYTIDVSAGET